VQQTDLKITQLKYMHLENSPKLATTNPEKSEMKKEKSTKPSFVIDVA